MPSPEQQSSEDSRAGVGGRSRRWVLAVLIAALVGAGFAGSLGHGFVLIDDDTNVYANPLVHPASEGRLERTWREPYLQLYIPVTYTVWARVADLAQVEGDERPQAEAGLSPLPFHWLNLIVHVVVALLVFAILRLLLDVDLAAALGALVFALHPLQAEPVAWVSGFKDLAGGGLGLGSLWLYLVHARSQGRGGGAWFGSLALFALAFLAKPSAVSVPVFMGVLDLLVLRRGLGHAVRSVGPFLILAAVGVAVATGAQPGDSELPQLALWERVQVACDAFGFYACKVVAPFELAPFYGRRPEVVLDQGGWWIGALVAVGLLAGALAVRRRSGVPLAALGLFGAGLGPVLGLVPFTFQVFSTVADRYAYTALIGPALLVGWLARGRKPVLLVGLVAAGLLGVRTIDQVRVWEDSKGLFVHSLGVFEGSSFVHSNLGEVYAREGDAEAAFEHFERAVELKPGSAQLRNNLGTYMGQGGRLPEALEQLSEAVRLDPDYAGARMNLASTLIGLNRYGEAVAELREVHRIDPGFAPAYQTRAALHGALGDAREAERALEELIEAVPDHVDGRVQLAGQWLQANRVQDAIVLLRKALELAPEHAQVNAELGRALLMSNRPVDALPYLEQAALSDTGLELTEMLQYARAAAGAE